MVEIDTSGNWQGQKGWVYVKVRRYSYTRGQVRGEDLGVEGTMGIDEKIRAGRWEGLNERIEG